MNAFLFSVLNQVHKHLFGLQALFIIIQRALIAMGLVLIVLRAVKTIHLIVVMLQLLPFLQGLFVVRVQIFGTMKVMAKIVKVLF